MNWDCRRGEEYIAPLRMLQAMGQAELEVTEPQVVEEHLIVGHPPYLSSSLLNLVSQEGYTHNRTYSSLLGLFWKSTIRASL